MSGSRAIPIGLKLVLLASAFFLLSCAQRNDEVKNVEPEPRVVAPTEATARLLTLASPTPTPALARKPLAPPTPTDLRDTVARVFEKVATPDTSREPNFATGDFNGDGSEDLAVIIKANDGSVGEINNELANWSLEDPRSVPPLSTSTRVPPAKRAHVEKGDTLLAIIHGVGPEGWRAADAKQTYLLKNGAGAKLVAQSFESKRSADKKLPRLKGDVLNETIGSQSGFVFWTGAKYAWWAASSH